MTMKPMMLGFVALLGACGGGGGGTPVVENAPRTPAPEQVPEEPAPSTPPDPVTFVFDTAGKSEIAVVGDTIVFDGVTYQTDELQSIYADGNSSFFTGVDEGRLTGLFAARILDEDATAAVGMFARDASTDQGYQREPDAGAFSVPALANVVPGQATFRGEYAGLIIQRAQIGADGERAGLDSSGAIIVGDVVLDVEFADYLSQGSFAGVIENRIFRTRRDGLLNTTTALTDITIENGRFDDTGQLTADISGGEWRFLNYVGPGDDVFDTTPSTLTGQLGGDGGTVIAGTLLLEHQRYESFPPDFERSDILQHADTEIGAFVVRQD